ncbi:MAG: YIP1 family protein [Pseudomonadota bacterium]
MSVTRDILQSYRRPRKVVRRRIGPDPREDRALAYVMAACLVIYVAQWPRLSREAFLDGEIPLQALLGAALLGWILIMPLILYCLAGLIFVVARPLIKRGSAYETRVALFWGLLASTPLWSLYGLMAGFIGPGPALQGIGTVLLIVLLYLWSAGLREVFFGSVSLETPGAGS